ncbi:MAG: aldo/keto reductase [Burkholderiales bacterium]
MEYRSLGRTGMMVSPVCLGTFNFGGPTSESDAMRIIERAIDARINFFDTAGNYQQGQSEQVLGRAIAMLKVRDDVIIGTKVHFPIGPGPNDFGNSRYHIMRACEASLKRLGVDHIDLYQMHRPSFDIPVDETLGALTDLVRQGKVRYIGCSTHPAWKVMEALKVSEANHLARYISEQPPYNLLDRRIENELVPICRQYGLGILPYAPLAQGVLAGRYSDIEQLPADSRAVRMGDVYAGRVNARGIAVGAKLADLARQHNMTPAQLAFLWVKDQPGITAPIIGPRTYEQFTAVLPAFDMRLSTDLADACDRLVPPGTAVADFHNASGWHKEVVGW